MTCKCKCDEGYNLSSSPSQSSSLGYYFCNKEDDSYGPVGAIYHNPGSASPITAGSGYEGEVGKRDDSGDGGDLEFVTIAEGDCVKYYSETWEGMQGL